MGKELRNLKSLAKRIVHRDTRRKIKKIKDRLEKIDLYKHSIMSSLEMRMHNLEKEIKSVGEENDVFHLIAKTNLLSTKIKYFYITHSKSDLKGITKLLKEVEREISKLKV